MEKTSGTGNYFINLTEYLLFGYKNKCVFNQARYIPNAYDGDYAGHPVDLWQEWKRPGRHSAKPSLSYKLIESVSEAPRLEMFARPVSPLFEKVPGWSCWERDSVRC